MIRDVYSLSKWWWETDSFTYVTYKFVGGCLSEAAVFMYMILCLCRPGREAVGHPWVQRGKERCACSNWYSRKRTWLPQHSACHQLWHASRYWELWYVFRCSFPSCWKYMYVRTLYSTKFSRHLMLAVFTDCPELWKIRPQKNVSDEMYYAIYCKPLICAKLFMWNAWCYQSTKIMHR